MIGSISFASEIDTAKLKKMLKHDDESCAYKCSTPCEAKSNPTEDCPMVGITKDVDTNKLEKKVTGSNQRSKTVLSFN